MTIRTVSLILLVSLGLAGCGGAKASDYPTDRNKVDFQSNGFRAWLSALREEAVSDGISAATVDAAFRHVSLDPKVISHDQNQPETTQSFAVYRSHTISPERIADGRAFYAQNFALLQQIDQRFGVPPQIVLALWGMESNFGRNSGDYEIVGSLATLAYQSHRAAFFRGQLLSALRILDEEHMSVDQLRGSWAGAMGQPQFMPTTYLHYAVDYEGDGKRDIWNDQNDVFASIANYLASEGWRPGLGWGFEVVLTRALALQDIGIDHRHSLIDWNRAGIRAVNGNPLPMSDVEASLIQPDGAEGRSYLVYENFRSIMRWNRSTYFAVSVGLLSDQIGRP